MSILTICFHAVNRSIKMSEGLSSWGAVFFLIWRIEGSNQVAATLRQGIKRTKDWFLDIVEPWRLDTEVVRDMASSLLPP
jgi:hypothetical protein